MSLDSFFQQTRRYVTLSPEAEQAWSALMKERTYRKGDYFVRVGQIPRNVAFVIKGLLSQYYLTEKGDTVIKLFFPEGRIAGSIPATLTRTESPFAIQALEDTIVLEYDFLEFKRLVSEHRDLAELYIRYMEQHWVIDKEPGEVSLRHDSAAVRYDEFLKCYPDLIKRIKKHHLAAYLGITPTQLSRIFFASK